jgi:hypothetical protein
MPANDKPKLSKRALQMKRAAHAENMLATWIKRAGIAVNKVREYSRKTAYYRKVLTTPKPSKRDRALRKFFIDEA